MIDLIISSRQRTSASTKAALLSVVLLCALSLTAAEAIEPVIAFGFDTATVSGVTPGGKTVWLSLAHETPSYNLRITEQVALVVDDDRDGTVRHSFGRRLPHQSVWVVLDLTQGAMAVATPDRTRVRRRVLPPGALRPGTGDRTARLAASGEYLTFLYVRPAVGAWVVTVDDGTSSDGDQLDDGNVSVPLDRMQPIGDSPPPPKGFKPGDVVVTIDPLTFEVFDLRVMD